MRRLTPLLLVAMTFGVLSAKAGETTSNGDMKAVVPRPQPPETCNWSGFYIGANVGGAFDRADIDLNLDGEWDAFPEPNDGNFAEGLGNKNLDADGLVAGGFLGYNFQWNNWVLGAAPNDGHAYFWPC